MKKIFLYLICLTAFLNGNAQNISFTIKPGSTARSAKVWIKTNAAKSGVISQTLLTFTLPASVGTMPTATFTLSAGFTHLAQSPSDPSSEMVNGENTYVFNFYSAYVGTVSNTLSPTGGPLANGEYEFGEITFTAPGNTNSVLKLSSIPGGGNSSISYLALELGGVNISNTAALTYGTGSTNSASYAGYSFVPLNITLPTKFLSFFATKSNDVANLIWTVDNEENNAYFEVERSLDGRNFSKAYKVEALRNGRTSNSYTTPDANISRLGVKTIYYRIKQVEASGKVVYSDIRSVNLVDKNFSASLFPNPVKGNTTLVMDAPEAGKATVIIRDVAGKTIKSISLQLVKGINQQQLDASMFAAGDYNVTIVSEKMNQTIKMTKAN